MGTILLVTREVTGFETAVMTGLTIILCGEGYDFEEIGLFGTEAVLKYFEANTPNYVDCGTDVDKFINICLQFK